MSDSEKTVNIETKFRGDIFKNLDQLKIGQNFADVIGVKKKLTTVPVRKPSRQDFVMVHPDESYHFQCATFELKEDRTHFIVVPELWPLFPNEIVPKALYNAQNRQGVLFLWPVRLPDETGRLDTWNQSAHKAAQMAM